MFTTGFGRFDFFFAALISFALQYFLDKIFMTYWYKPTQILSDPTNSTTMKVLRFAVCLYLVMGFYVFQNNQCTISSQLLQDIVYPN